MKNQLRLKFSNDCEVILLSISKVIFIFGLQIPSSNLFFYIKKTCLFSSELSF